MNDQPISNEQLILYAIGDMDIDIARVEAFLSSSPKSEEYVALVRRVLEIMAGDDTEAPTVDAVERALDVFNMEPCEQKTGWLKGVRQVVADLIFDSRDQVALAGFRGSCSTYQLAYEVDQIRIDLRVSRFDDPQGAGGRVRGQITSPKSGAVGSVALTRAGTTDVVASTRSDEHGQFRLNGESGMYDVVADVAGVVILAPGVEIS